MTMTKVSFLFNHARMDPNSTTPNAITRMSGWSEQWYSGSAFDSSGLFDNIDAWAKLRAKLMGSSAAVVGFRVSEVDPTGKSFVRRKTFPGRITTAVDSPEQCLLLNVNTVDGKNRREITLRSIPDARIEKGEYLNQQQFDNDLRAFLNHCKNAWGFRGKGHAIAPKKIVKITTGGLVTTEADHGLTEDTHVQIYRTLTPERRQTGIKDIIAVVTGARALTLVGPTGLPGECTKGEVRVVEGYALKTMELSGTWFEQLYIGKRDTGRPFFQSRGRRSARRR